LMLKSLKYLATLAALMGTSNTRDADQDC